MAFVSAADAQRVDFILGQKLVVTFLVQELDPRGAVVGSTHNLHLEHVIFSIVSRTDDHLVVRRDESTPHVQVLCEG